MYPPFGRVRLLAHYSRSGHRNCRCFTIHPVEIVRYTATERAVFSPAMENLRHGRFRATPPERQKTP